MRIPFRLPDRPKTREGLVNLVMGMFSALRTVVGAMVLVVVVMLLGAAVIVQVGRDGRENVCDVTERALIRSNARLTAAFLAPEVQDPTKPPLTDEQAADLARRAAAFRRILDDGTRADFADCNG